MSYVGRAANNVVRILQPSTPYDGDDLFCWGTEVDTITGQGGTVGALSEYVYQPSMPNRTPGGASATLGPRTGGSGPYLYTGNNLFGGPTLMSFPFTDGGWVGGAGTTQPTSNWSASIWYRPFIKDFNTPPQVLFGRSRVSNPTPGTATDWSWYFYDQGLAINDPRVSIGIRHKRASSGTFDEITCDPTNNIVRQPVVNRWHLLQAAYDGTSLYFRIDGKLVTFIAAAGLTHVDNTNGLWLIGSAGTNTNAVVCDAFRARVRGTFDTPAFVAGEYARGAPWGA